MSLTQPVEKITRWGIVAPGRPETVVNELSDSALTHASPAANRFKVPPSSRA